jgi:hypothetical protein
MIPERGMELKTNAAAYVSICRIRESEQTSLMTCKNVVSMPLEQGVENSQW